MDRRNFLKMLVGGVATAAAVRTFPFRVFSLPSKPIRVDWNELVTVQDLYIRDGGAFRRIENGPWMDMGKSPVVWMNSRESSVELVKRSSEISIEEAKGLYPMFNVRHKPTGKILWSAFPSENPWPAVILDENCPKDEIRFITPHKDEYGRITGSRVDKIINIGGV
jgi:hypothetical protein